MASQVVDRSDNVQERIRFGPFVANVHTHELWKEGTRIKLIGQPFEILAVFLTKPGKLVTREELRFRLWAADTFVDFNHGLNAAINKLRDALCDSADKPRYIETLPRRGYRFIAAVEPADYDQLGSAEVYAAEVRAKDQPVRTPPAGGPEAQEIILFESHKDFGGGETGLVRKPGIWLAIPAVLFLALLFGALIWFFRAHPSPSGAVGQRAWINSAPLTDLADPTSDPAVSPDGTRVAFRRHGYAAGNSGIYVKAIDSQQLLQLTNNPSDCCPVWSPNRRLIAFSRFTNKEHEIYTIGANGGGLYRLFSTAIGPHRGELDWSPDGRSLAFVGQSSRGSSSIFLLSYDDRTARRITGPLRLDRDWGPVFSPDGQSLAFVRETETGLPENILVMPAQG